LPLTSIIIAKHIPTKRELKHKLTFVFLGYPGVDCKAHPDEKGIETHDFPKNGLIVGDCKAHPDEKGIET